MMMVMVQDTYYTLQYQLTQVHLDKEALVFSSADHDNLLKQIKFMLLIPSLITSTVTLWLPSFKICSLFNRVRFLSSFSLSWY